MQRSSIILVAAAVGFCSCEEQDAGARPYTGNSQHWKQQEVPISLQCAACHRKEFEQWAASDHAWAWRQVDLALDSEPFHGQELQAHGEKLSFRTNRQGQLLLTNHTNGETYKVHSVLGRRPLVQYLVEGKDGGLHTPSAAWDVHQREWFDVFAGDARLSREGLAQRQHGDWGHWLGRGMNWNSQCAWCHMTEFRKGYDATTDTYRSTWKEPGVTCIQCHPIADKPDATNGCMAHAATRKLNTRQIHDNCATCHARREELDDTFRAGDSFDEHFRLELPLVEGIFYPNGMQQDEDYCETGLRLSKMGQAGVSCIDCHDPHSAELKLPQEDNSLCLRCHASGTMVNGTPAPIIDLKTHTPCPPESEGGRCVECHMPESPYMARDPRRDHSFQAPDPQLSTELGLPNTCLRCHTGKDHAWTQQHVDRVYTKKTRETTRPRTRAVAAAMRGQANEAELLAALKQETNKAWRATLLEHLATLPRSEAVLQAAKQASQDESAMVRAAAAQLLGGQSQEMLQDSSRLVRRAAAWQNLGQLHQLPSAQKAHNEQVQTATHQADQPTGAMQLAMLARAAGNHAEVDKQYKRAIALDASSPVAYMDYAVYLAGMRRPAEALAQMLNCAAKAPQNALVQYRLGLILAECGYIPEAIRAMQKALDIEPNYPQAQQAMQQLLPHAPSSPNK